MQHVLDHIEIRKRHADDSGHQRWYLDDLAALGLMPSVAWLFGPEHATTRLHSHRLMAGVLAARHDTSRIALVLALEAAGDCIFKRMPRYVASAGVTGLRYFSSHHFDVEQSHALHDDALTAWLRSAAVPGEAVADGRRVVDAIFDAIDAMIIGYEARAVASDTAAGGDARDATATHVVGGASVDASDAE